MDRVIRRCIEDSINLKRRILNDDLEIKKIEEIANVLCCALEKKGKILLCGNGGSASDALHIAAEFVGRFQKERMAYPAIALNADMASVTAIANDYGYDMVFARAVEGYMQKNDILIGISTSGNSVNVYEAIKKAKEMGSLTIALLGKDGGSIKELADFSIVIPCNNTARIQECHILIGHILCELVEDKVQNLKSSKEGSL